MEELLDDDKRRDEILVNALEELKVHFDTVHIITTKKSKDGGVVYQSQLHGNFYEVWGAVRSADARFRAQDIDG